MVWACKEEVLTFQDIYKDTRYRFIGRYFSKDIGECMMYRDQDQDNLMYVGIRWNSELPTRNIEIYKVKLPSKKEIIEEIARVDLLG